MENLDVVKKADEIESVANSEKALQKDFNAQEMTLEERKEARKKAWEQAFEARERMTYEEEMKAWKQVIETLKTACEEEPERVWTEEESVQLREQILEKAESWRNEENLSELQRLILSRTRTVKMILTYRLGLYDGIVHSRAATARAFQISETRVRQIEAKDLRPKGCIRRRRLSDFLK